MSLSYSSLSARNNKISSINSTNVALDANASFIGEFEEILPFSGVSIISKSDVNGTLFIEYSTNGVDTDGGPGSFSATPSTLVRTPVNARYIRVRYTNGATPQTFLHIQTIYSYVPQSMSVAPVTSAIFDQSTALTTKTVILAKNPDNTYSNIVLGQQDSAHSLPVVFSTDQSSVPTNISTVIPTISTFSSMTPLGANATFSPPGEDVSTFVNADITVIADQDSAVDGLVFSWSQDGILYDYEDKFTILANVGRNFSLSAKAKFFKVSYTNGAIAQGVFQLSTVYYPTHRSVYIENIDKDIIAGRTADVVRSVLAGQKEVPTPTGRYRNCIVNDNGSLKTFIDTQTVPPLASNAAKESTLLQARPELSSKFRIIPSTSVISIPSTVNYTNLYSYTGSGLLLGFSQEFSANRAVLRLQIDGETVLDGVDLAVLVNFFANANSVDRRQSGSGLVIQGGNIDFSPHRPIRFNSSIVISARLSTGTALNRTQGLIFIQLET